MEKIIITENKGIIRAECENGLYLELEDGLYPLNFVKSSKLTNEKFSELSKAIYDYVKEKDKQKLFGVDVQVIYAHISLAVAIASLACSVKMLGTVYENIPRSDSLLTSEAIEYLGMAQQTSRPQEIKKYLAEAIEQMQVNTDSQSVKNYQNKLNYLLPYLNAESVPPERLEAVRNIIQEYSKIKPNNEVSLTKERLAWFTGFTLGFSILSFVYFEACVAEIRN